MKQPGFILAIFITFSSFGQKTKPIAVQFIEEDNITLIYYKKGQDFELPGKWVKYNESGDQWKYWLTDTDSNAIGIKKFPQKKLPIHQNDMTRDEFMLQYIKWRETALDKYPSGKEEFSLSDQIDHADYRFYRITGKSTYFLDATNDTISIPAYSTINLVGVKNGVVYDLSAFEEKGNTSYLENLLLTLFNNN